MREVRGGEPGALRGDAWTAGSCGRPARRTQRPAPPQKCLRLKRLQPDALSPDGLSELGKGRY